MRKPDFCLCENKDADQLRGDREADQRLRFRYTDNNASSYIQGLQRPVCVRPGRKPRRPVFSERGSNNLSSFYIQNFKCLVST